MTACQNRGTGMNKKIIGLKSNISVVFAIPTYNCEQYIYQALTRYRAEILSLPKHINFSIAVCLNGTETNDLATKEILRFKSEYPDCKLHLIREPKANKNIALNHLIQYAKFKGMGIIHFIDDDVIFKKGSIELNIMTLLERNAKGQTPILVGSNPKAILKPFSFFWKSKSSLIKALSGWFWYNVFSLPFLPTSKNALFCTGKSMAAFVNEIPNIPEDQEILDDGYLSQRYALLGRESFEKSGISPIVKPYNSIVYFDSEASLSEWKGAETRVYALARKTFLFHKEHYDFLTNFLAWPYTYPRNSRMSLNLGWKQLILYPFFRYFQDKMEKKAFEIVDNKENIRWNPATSTKFVKVE